MTMSTYYGWLQIGGEANEDYDEEELERSRIGRLDAGLNKPKENRIYRTKHTKPNETLQQNEDNDEEEVE